MPRKLIVAAFFLGAAAVGFLAVDGYGVSADEPAMYTDGVQMYAYLFMGGPLPSVYDWTFTNPVVHAAMFGIERWLGVELARSTWLLRHFLSYLLFLGGVGAFYAIAKRMLGDWRLALLGCAMFLLSPRVFAHAFYNPKDVPALALFTIAMATLLAWRASGYAWRWLAAHALACALIVSIRAFGILLPAFTILALAADVGLAEGAPVREKLRVFTSRAAAFAGACAALLVAVWPLLWADPAGNFLRAFSTSAGRTGGGLYLGRPMEGVPWHYIPVWIGITTPPIFTLLALIGTGALGTRIIRAPLSFFREEAGWLLIVLWILVPLVVIPLFDFGIADEWRHVLFVYPAFLLVGLRGLRWLLTGQQVMVQRVSATITALAMAWTAGWMVVHHPLQFGYFSIPARFVEGAFELDYWGLSYREGLAWVLAHDRRAAIPVYTAARAGHISADLFPLDQWRRFRFVQATSADYILDNFRGNGYRRVLPDDRELHRVAAGGLTLLSVYRGPAEEGEYPRHTE